MFSFVICFSTSFPWWTYQLSGYSREIALNSNGPQYDEWYIHDGEIYGAQWLKEKATPNAVINSDRIGKLILIEYFSAYYPLITLTNNTEINGYLYLRYQQVSNNNSNEYIENKKIYDSRWSEIWR